MAIKKSRRFEVLVRYGFACAYCGRMPPEVKLHVDHAMPRARGGGDEDDNLVSSCEDCNHGKAARIYPIRQSPLSHLTFLTWLRAQKLRDDPVGDLAEDEAHDPLIEPISFAHLSRQLRHYKACHEAIHAAWNAWREYRRGGRPTRMIRKVQDHMASRVRDLPADTMLWLKAGMYFRDESTGEVVFERYTETRSSAKALRR